MKNDFITVFKTIEADEQEGFRHYVQCFYAQQKAVIKIFKEVDEAIIANKEATILLSTKPEHKNILNALSDLKKWLLEYLAFRELKSDSHEAQFFTVEALRKRGLNAFFLQKSKQFSKELMKHPSPDMWLMFWKLRLAHIHYFHTGIDRMQDYQAEMHKILNELDSFYISAKLRYNAELQSRTDILQETYTPRLLDEIGALAENDDTLDASIRSLYLPLLKLLKNKSEDAYRVLKSFIINNQVHESFERLSILMYLLNFAINQIRQGNNLYFDEYFELAQLGLDQSLFTTSGYFPTDTFMNIVNLSCHQKKYVWAKKFIATWSEYLDPVLELPTKNLAMARIYFEEKNYGKVIDLLQKIPNKPLTFNLNARVLLARAYYERKEPDDLILDYCQSLYLYAYRSKSIGADPKLSITNFVKIMRYLVNGKSKTDIYNELNKEKEPIMCRQWLKEKADALKS